MHGDTCRLLLEQHTGHSVSDRVEGHENLAAQPCLIGVERVDEVDIELRAVTADEVDLRWQTG